MDLLGFGCPANGGGRCSDASGRSSRRCLSGFGSVNLVQFLSGQRANEADWFNAVFLLESLDGVRCGRTIVAGGFAFRIDGFIGGQSLLQGFDFAVLRAEFEGFGERHH